MSTKRLIETAFPLAEASAASLHEKNMRHGHISTLHLWPARRPLAASRAAIAAALLPDPGNDAERAQLVRRLGGRLVPKKKTKAEEGTKVESEKVTGDGGILWWGQESGPDLAWFREAILKANGGKPPRVLDPFAGGGAIPLEAMRLGCEVTANDLNPVAWFILKCTLEYPQKLAGERRPLPDFALKDAAFMEAFLKAQGMKPGPQLRQQIALAAGSVEAPKRLLELEDHPWMKADLGWHVRAWGQWVLGDVRRELAPRYPTYAEWISLAPNTRIKPQPLRLLHPDVEGRVSVEELNSEIAEADLRSPEMPRWVMKPTVAYLWARTVRCNSCRATVPLLKTRWLSRRPGKRVRLLMEPTADRLGVVFGVEANVAAQGSSSAAIKKADKALAGGTMSRSGVRCPCCGTLMSMEDIRYEGKHGRLGAVLTAVVVDGPAGKEYRTPTQLEAEAAAIEQDALHTAFSDIPFGLPSEPTPKGGNGAARAFSVAGYGLTRWSDLYTERQLLALSSFVRAIRRVPQAASSIGYPSSWHEPLYGLLCCGFDRMLDFNSTLVSWIQSVDAIGHTFVRYALPIVWDYSEAAPINGVRGGWVMCLDAICEAASTAQKVPHHNSTRPKITFGSAKALIGANKFDLIITDPPYYDAIPYSDLMDYFFVWLRRLLADRIPNAQLAFTSSHGPKWNHDEQDGELIDDASRFETAEASKRNFEDGMLAVFRRCAELLEPDGRFVIVFANKKADAWETLVSAIIRAGFVVESSWPIQTEQAARIRAQASAALASSVWLVCRTRSAAARPGYRGRVLDEMQASIRSQLHRFWDAGIRGPDFVWAATGPALEAYSRHPVVFRESSTSGERERFPVSEFLREVRRLVVEFAVGRVMRKAADGSTDESAVLDDITTYYVLHRDSFGMEDAPIGACILYALSCGVPDSELADRYEILAKTGGKAAEPEDEDGSEDGEDGDGEAAEASSGTGSAVRLRRWDQRKRKNLGLEGYGGRPAPMIDRVHRVMQLWKEGDVAKVNAFLDQAGVARDPLFAHLIQALIELARRDGKVDEAALLESISNHLQSRAGISAMAQASLDL